MSISADPAVPAIRKASVVEGDTLVFRNATVADAEFILSLRTDTEKSRYLSATANDLGAQREWLEKYNSSDGQAYFIIQYQGRDIGTVRLYDAKGDSFCWGSWILTNDRPRHAAMESSLMVYAYACDHLGFRACHFDVRKGNDRVVAFHHRFGAECVSESDQDFFFVLSGDAIRSARVQYAEFLNDGVKAVFL